MGAFSLHTVSGLDAHGAVYVYAIWTLDMQQFANLMVKIFKELLAKEELLNTISSAFETAKSVDKFLEELGFKVSEEINLQNKSFVQENMSELIIAAKQNKFDEFRINLSPAVVALIRMFIQSEMETNEISEEKISRLLNQVNITAIGADVRANYFGEELTIKHVLVPQQETLRTISHMIRRAALFRTILDEDTPIRLDPLLVRYAILESVSGLLLHLPKDDITDSSIHNLLNELADRIVADTLPERLISVVLDKLDGELSQKRTLYATHQVFPLGDTAFAMHAGCLVPRSLFEKVKQETEKYIDSEQYNKAYATLALITPVMFYTASIHLLHGPTSYELITHLMGLFKEKFA